MLAAPMHSRGPQPGKKGRPCPALNALISPVECGLQRGSPLACPSTCSFFPFGRAGYDLWRRVDAEWTRKALDRVLRVWGRDRLQARTKACELPLEEARGGFEAALSRALHHLVFREPAASGRTLAEAWEAAGWEGLNHDEQLMSRQRRNTRWTLLEIQRLEADGTLICADLLDPARPAFPVLDRLLAPRVVRFTRLLTGLTDYTHFSALTLPTVEIPLLLWEAWWGWWQEQLAAAGPAVRGPDLLEARLGEAIQFHQALLRHYRLDYLDKLGLLRHLARYRLEAPAGTLEAACRQHPALRPVDPPDPFHLGPPRAAFVWNETAPPDARPDETPPPAEPTVLRLFDQHLVVEAANAARLEQARARLEADFAGQLRFEETLRLDLTRQMQRLQQQQALVAAAENAIFGGLLPGDAPPATAEAGAAPTAGAPPAESPEDLRAEHEARYQRLLDQPLSLLGDLTPRQAAADPARRPQLIEWVKVHLHHLEQRNRRERVHLSLDAFLDALGLSELK